MGLVYASTKAFHFKSKIDSLSPETDRIEPPVHIRIKPTNRCGHNCYYCAYRSEDLQLGKDMKTQDFIPEKKMLEIIDDIIEIGVKAVTFSGGGDPFYYPYLLPAVKKLSRSEVKFAALTNGARLSGELADIFAHNATWLRVSMDGWDNESYSFYRRVSFGEFTKLMKNLENFKKLGGKCYLGVSLIVDKHNANHIYEFARRIKTLGVQSIKISPCIIDNEGCANNEYHMPLFEQVKEQICRVLEDLADENFEIFDAYHQLDAKFEKNYQWCPYIQILPVIGADLNVYSCQDKAYNLQCGLIGSISNIRFKDFWFKDKSVFFKINPSIHCNHHCAANAKNKMILDYLSADEDHLPFV